MSRWTQVAWQLAAGAAFALVLAATPASAKALWTSSGVAASAVQGAPFAVSAVAAPGNATALDAGGTGAATARVGIRISAAAGAPPWTTGTGWARVAHAQDLAASVAIAAGLSTSAEDCTEVTYVPQTPSPRQSAVQIEKDIEVALPALGDGDDVLFCVEVTLTGLIPTDAGTVTVTIVPTATLGGWSASGSQLVTALPLSDILPFSAVCTPTTNSWYVSRQEQAADFVLPGGRAWSPIVYEVYTAAGTLAKVFNGNSLGTYGKPTLGTADLVDYPVPSGTHTFSVRPRGSAVTLATFVATVTPRGGNVDVTCGAAP